jgi:hypothetical protein
VQFLVSLVQVKVAFLFELDPFGFFIWDGTAGALEEDELCFPFVK